MRHQVVFILLLGFFTPATAQIVNIENKRLGGEDGWGGSLDMFVNFTKNTKELWQIGSKGAVQFQSRKHTSLFLVDYSLNKADNADFLNKGYTHFRYNYDFGDKQFWSAEAFGQAQFNKIQKIDIRVLSGAGLRLNLVDKDSLSFQLGSVAMYEYERLTINEIVENKYRSSTYLSFDIQPTATFGFNTIVYYQPRFDDFSDYRISNESTMYLKIASFITFKLIYNLSFDSRPPDGVPDTIYSLKNALSFRF